MLWTLRKIDSLVGTVIAAASAVAAAQLGPFIAYYLQRLGGHLDEARLNRQAVFENAVGLDGAARDRLLAEADARVFELERALFAISDAGTFEKPFAFARHADGEIVRATLAAFEPALSFDTASLVYGGAGILIAWALWEIVKLPFAFALRAAASD